MFYFFRGLASFIKAGFVNQNETGEIIPIIQRIKHPEYSPNTYYNDISLMELLRPVIFSLNLYPACLRYISSIEDKNAIAIGWGLTHWRKYYYYYNILPGENAFNEFNNNASVFSFFSNFLCYGFRK